MKKLLCCLLLAGLLCVSQSVDAKVKQTKLKIKTAKQVKVPKTFAADSVTFSKADLTIYDDPFLGGAVSYQSKQAPTVNITLYVYPMVHETLSVEQLLAYEFFSTNKQVQEVNDYRGINSVLMTDELLQINDKPVFFSRFSMTSEDGEGVSDTYLTHNQFHYIKIRISYPTGMNNDDKLMINSLASTLLEHTQVKEHKKTSLAQVVNVSEDDDFKPYYMGGQLVYLLVLSNAVSPDDLLLNFHEQLQILQRSTEILRQVNAEKDKSNDVIYLEDLADAGYLEELTWTRFQQPHWSPPEDLDLDGFESWLEARKDKHFYFNHGMGRLVINFEK